MGRHTGVACVPAATSKTRGEFSARTLGTTPYRLDTRAAPVLLHAPWMGSCPNLVYTLFLTEPYFPAPPWSRPVTVTKSGAGIIEEKEECCNRPGPKTVFQCTGVVTSVHTKAAGVGRNSHSQQEHFDTHARSKSSPKCEPNVNSRTVLVLGPQT